MTQNYPGLIRKFNLIYHIYFPGQENLILQYNIYLLKQYINKFNGKKIININFIGDINNAKVFIDKYFDIYHNIEFIYTPNDESSLCETYIFFNKLLPRVYSLDDYEYTFFGHTKGVHKWSQNDQNMIFFLWCHTLYSRNLQDTNNIANILDTYTCCGTLKRNQPIHFLENAGYHTWHYTGAFFWFNNKKLFSKPNWYDHHGSRYGLETYLPRILDSKEAFGLSPDMIGDTHDLNSWLLSYNII